MNWKIIIGSLALIFSNISCTPSPSSGHTIIGTWRSDRDKSAEYNEKHVKAEECVLSAYKQMMGNAEFEYRANGTLQLTQNAFHIDGCLNRKSEMNSIQAKNTYKIIAQDEDTMILEITAGSTGSLMQLHFDSADQFWIYSQIGHLREYFTRVKK